MRLLTLSRHALITVALSLSPSVVPTAWAQTSKDPLPPAKTYFVDKEGKRLGIKERWAEDANGEKHGRYLKYNENGLVIENLPFVHGAQTGSGYFYSNFNKQFYSSLQKRPDTKFSGTYRSGKTVGAWEGRSETTNELRMVILYNADGIEQKRTYYSQGKVGSVVESNVPATPISAPVSRSPEELARERAASARSAAQKEALIQDARLRYFSVNARNIYFPADSYILPKGTLTVLDTIAAGVNRRRKSEYKVKEIFVSTHVEKPRRETTEAGTQMMYVLTLNRAYAIKDYLRAQLIDTDTPITTYACAWNLEDNDYVEDEVNNGTSGARVQISVKGDLLKARAVYEQLAGQYSLRGGDGLVASTLLQENILNTIRAYFVSGTAPFYEMMERADGNTNFARYLEKIPSELWLTDLTKVVPGTYVQVENPAQFRSRVEKIFSELNEKCQSKFLPSVLFNADLERRVQLPAR